MLKATISEKKYLTPTTLLVRLDLKETLSLHAGQHIILNIPEDEELIERPFSIASPPNDRNRIDIVVRLVQGGIASTFLKNSKIGTQVTLKGPKGGFGIQSNKQPLYLIASGSGVAPFRSMLPNLLKEHKKEITLFFVVSAKKELFFQQEFKKLTAAYNNFQYVPIVSNPKHLSYLRNIHLNSEADFYLCGGFHFVNDITKLLKKKGVAKKRIHLEEFK